jgi:hypothetical protein
MSQNLHMTLKTTTCTLLSLTLGPRAWGQEEGNMSRTYSCGVESFLGTDAWPDSPDPAPTKSFQL